MYAMLSLYTILGHLQRETVLVSARDTTKSFTRPVLNDLSFVCLNSACSSKHMTSLCFLKSFLFVSAQNILSIYIKSSSLTSVILSYYTDNVFRLMNEIQKDVSSLHKSHPSYLTRRWLMRSSALLIITFTRVIWSYIPLWGGLFHGIRKSGWLIREQTNSDKHLALQF